LIESNQLRWLGVAGGFVLALGISAPTLARAALRDALTESSARSAVAAHYAPGVMERVAELRGMPLVDCMLSSPWHELGEWVRVESMVNDEVAICRATDVSAPEDHARHLKRKLVELDWPTAKRLCELSRLGEKPPDECPVLIDKLRADGGPKR
jgi:hypothetical protein